MEAGLKKLEASEVRFAEELDNVLKQYVKLQEQAAEFDPAELYEERQAICSDHEQSAIPCVQYTYGNKYNPLLMFENRWDVSELLNEEAEALSA